MAAVRKGLVGFALKRGHKGHLWPLMKDIFIPSSQYVFLVHSGTQQFWTISKLTCSHVYVFFEVDWSGPYDLVSVQTLPGLSALRPFLNKVYELEISEVAPNVDEARVDKYLTGIVLVETERFRMNIKAQPSAW